jgi:hypothetical protein
MRVELLAFYGGPDQVMTVTSGLASLIGLLLIFWNKVVATFFRVVRIFRPAAKSAVPEVSENAPKETP